MSVATTAAAAASNGLPNGPGRCQSSYRGGCWVLAKVLAGWVPCRLPCGTYVSERDS
jgi:hypothetical protein